MATEQARPKAQPPAKKAPTSKEMAAAIHAKSNLRITKEQGSFDEQARALAARLGWDGEPGWVLNWIQVSDAQRFLAKTLHEVHVAALNDLDPPHFSAVCSHLGIQIDSEDAEAIEKSLKDYWDQERGKPTSPTS